MKNPDKSKWEHNNKLDLMKNYSRMESKKDQSKKAKESFKRKPYQMNASN